jgi:SAM-dependent methyltransferase
VRGDAGQLPLADAAFDLVYCVDAIHHFDRPKSFISRARHLLRPGGALAVIGNDSYRRRDSWYAYRYFKGTYETDLRRFPSRSTLEAWMMEAGFTDIQWRQVERIVDHKHGREVLDDPFLDKDSCSQLALLTDQEYAAGLQRIERALQAADARRETLCFPVDICKGALIGRCGPGCGEGN